jgi:outer membrane protein OmpA-like peptidoglycan-associated protein
LVTLGDVLFEVGQADLKPGIQRKLFPLAEFLKENPDRNVLIEGHTDNTGAPAYNLELSQRRADTVASFLISQGVSPASITSRGYGQDYPVAPNTTAAGRQQNRRVEVVILREGKAASQMMRQ